MDAIRKIEAADSEAMADAVMEHLGPLALTHGRISPIVAFELGWKARAQALASKEAELVRCRAALECIAGTTASEHGTTPMMLTRCMKLANSALTTQPPKEPT